MEIELKKFINNAGCKNILVIGVVHGDEPQGEYLIKRYLKNKSRNIKNNLYYIPRLNSSNTRKNKNGIDLNRNFPSKNWKIGPCDEYFGGYTPASEDEVKFLIDLTNKVNFDAIITIHSPYKIINFDGPAKTLAEKISNILDYPVQQDIGYETPGSMGTYFGTEKNIPIITIEIDENINLDVLYLKFEKLFKYIENDY